MLHINERVIQDLLNKASSAGGESIDAILAKSRSLKRLSLSEAAVLLAVKDPLDLKNIFDAASFVKDAIYGRRIVIFAPLYISNVCANACVYCSFKSDNSLLLPRTLTTDEIKKETEWLLSRGHKRILMVSAESQFPDKNIDYYVEAVKAIYEAHVGPHRIRRVNVNCAPLSADAFKKLKAAGIGTYQLFQETYHDRTYRSVHPSGPKSDPDNRIDAIDRAFSAGIDDIGIGALYGLYDWKFETLALLSHVEYLETRFGIGPHTISVPRIEPALGADFSYHAPYKVSDEDFKKIVAVLRLAVPYTGIILSTREPAALRDELFGLGVSQVSAESKTSPGGYSLSDTENSQKGTQFSLSDTRSLDAVIASLLEKDFIPSFCAACYRKERTGEAFMKLAKPGTIKGKCSLNALITLKEYLDDFASWDVKEAGYRLIERIRHGINNDSRIYLEQCFEHIDKGVRDEYV